VIAMMRFRESQDISKSCTDLESSETRP
jgi:hypothetical protein